MSFMDGLKKVGKIALMAAPYVAAPFTGGASLMATGLANKAVQKWSEHDAKDAIAHGLEPSSFDRILNKVGTVSSLASSVIPTNALGAVGLLGKAGGAAAKVSGVAGKTASILSNVNKASNIGGAALSTIAGRGGAAQSDAQNPLSQASSNQSSNTGLGPTRTPLWGSSASQQAQQNQPGVLSSVMPRGGYRYKQNPMNQLDQNVPNLAQSIFQGRQEAINNQKRRLQPAY
jgi:hypothetical protein